MLCYHLNSLENMSPLTILESLRQGYLIIDRRDAKFYNSTRKLFKYIDVHCVPSLTHNLLSNEFFLDQGYNVFFNDVQCMVISRRTPFKIMIKEFCTPNILYRQTNLFQKSPNTKNSPNNLVVASCIATQFEKKAKNPTMRWIWNEFEQHFKTKRINKELARSHNPHHSRMFKQKKPHFYGKKHVEC